MSRTPARERLALAINGMTGVARVLEKAKQTVERATEFRDQAAARFEAASTAAISARDGHAAAMLLAAESGQAVATSTLNRDLRLAEADARDDLDAANSALETSQARLAEAQADLDRSFRTVHEARDLVIIEAMPAVLDDLRAIAAELYRKCEPLAFASHINMPGNPVSLHMRAFLGNMRIFLTRTTDGGREPPLPSTERWEAAAEALLLNPDAPLP